MTKEYRREYYLKNIDKIRSQKKAKRATDKYKEATRIYNLKYNESNKELRNAKRREKYKLNPAYNIEHRLRSRLQKIIKLAGISKIYRYHEYLGCSNLEFKEYIESQFTNDMNWDNRDKWHIDHKIPCCSFDLTNQEELKKCFHYTNLRPLWSKDNLEKAKIDKLCKRQK